MEKTLRGFDVTTFIDRYDKKCSLQKSSLAFEDCIWFGIADPIPQIMASKIMDNGVGWVNVPMHPDVQISGRMHLTRKMVAEMLPYLQKFVETGELQ